MTKSVLRLGLRGEEVKKLQKRLHINSDGIFGPATLNAVTNFQRNNGLASDGVVGEKTWGRLYGDLQYLTFNNIYMIKCKPQNIEVILLGNALHKTNANGINGTFFDTSRPTLSQSCWGLAVNKGSPLGPNAHITDWKGTKRGTIAWNGNKMICQRINHYREIPGMIWGISGVMLVPDYNRWIEKYLSDVYRKTNHTVIGFDDEYIYLIVQRSCTMTQLVETCKKLGLEGAVSLDGGGSSQLRFNNKGLVSSRIINSAVIVKG